MSISRDYRIRQHGFTGNLFPQNIEKRGGWQSKNTAQDSLNGDLPTMWVVIPLILIVLFAGWALFWSLYYAMNPQLLSLSESVVSPTSSSPSVVEQTYEGAFYSPDPSQILTISGVLDKLDVNDGWED